MTQARANISANVVQGCIYVLGGTTGAANAAWGGSATTYEYNIAGDTWTARGNYVGASRSNRITFVFGDVIYNSGGRISYNDLTTEHDGYIVPNLYNTNGALTSGATEVTLATSKRAGSASAFWENPDTGEHYVILLGGDTAINTNSNYVLQTGTPTAQNYHHWLAYPFTAANPWQGATALPTSLGFGSANIYGNTLYHFGGGVLSPVNTVYSYDLTTGLSGTWGTKTPMPNARMGHTALKAY